MTPRKYPVKKKTTTPDGYREYKKLQMRDRRAKQKAKNKEYLERIRVIPGFSELPSMEQKNIEKIIVQLFSDVNLRLNEKEDETEQYVKMRLNTVYESVFKTVKTAMELKRLMLRKAEAVLRK